MVKDELRDYQQNAVDSIIEHMAASYDSCLVEAATGAGKSLVIAKVAEWIERESGKKVLCLAPSKELTEQNREKYTAYGLYSSVYSASLNQKCTDHNVIFGMPISVFKNIDQFNDEYSAVIIDECQHTTDSIKKLIEELKAKNKKLRVIGFTATPYRLGFGYIYEIDGTNNNRILSETEARDPYFKKRIFCIGANELIKREYLTPPRVGVDVVAQYHDESLKVKNRGRFSAQDVRDIFENDDKTTSIIKQVIDCAQYRKGVLIFASSIDHAREILALLPPDESAILTSLVLNKKRAAILRAFKKQEIKFIVNVSILTTGFDAPHVDLIAILRPTESIALFQQIIGRGLRLSDGKEDCLILDYTSNIARHGLEDGLFFPVVRAKKNREKIVLPVKCPDCSYTNSFVARDNKDGHEIDDLGYFLDLNGHRIESDHGTYYPAHYGRRCQAEYLINDRATQCDFKWDSKACPKCGHENDIAAKKCEKCKARLIDPNDKLNRKAAQVERESQPFTCDVDAWKAKHYKNGYGNKSMRVMFYTPNGIFSSYFNPSEKAHFFWRTFAKTVKLDSVPENLDAFINKINSGEAIMPISVKVKKNDQGFFNIFGYKAGEAA